MRVRQRNFRITALATLKAMKMSQAWRANGGSFMGRALWVRFPGPRQPRVMKEILLCVAGVVAEVAGGEFAQPAGGDLALSREVKLSQHALDPDIDGERAQSLETEKQRAIRHLLADAGQPAQLRAARSIVERCDDIESDLAAC